MTECHSMPVAANDLSCTPHSPMNGIHESGAGLDKKTACCGRAFTVAATSVPTAATGANVRATTSARRLPMPPTSTRKPPSACGSKAFGSARIRPGILIAAALALFLVPVTAIFHAFSSADAAGFQGQLTHFLKNVAVFGGLLIVYGDERLRSAGNGKLTGTLGRSAVRSKAAVSSNQSLLRQPDHEPRS